jgi:hypothetical protein
LLDFNEKNRHNPSDGFAPSELKKTRLLILGFAAIPPEDILKR